MSTTRVSMDVTSIPSQPAGAGRYVIELAKQLAIRDDIALLPVARRGDGSRWSTMGDGLKVKAVAPRSRPLRLVCVEQTRLPQVLGTMALDVHHGPHYTMPERAAVPSVVTIHDMTLFDHPEWHESIKVRVFQRAIRIATKRAAALVAVSQDTASRLQERFGELDVTVIPHGVDHTRFTPTPTENDTALLRQFEIPGRYIAFVGTLEPRKDVPSLLAAFDRIAPQMPDTFLVLAGGSGWHAQEFVAAKAKMKYSSRVMQTGFLPDNVIPALLRNALVVAYPSLIEGFGLPALEALACGAPLITTTGSAMEEVVGDAALLIKPGDTDALAEALVALIEDEGQAQKLKHRGPEVAARFTWKASADAHAAVYKRVADQ